MTQTVKSPCKIVGGKSASAHFIVRNFPPPKNYRCYVELCGGAAHVLCAKPKWGHREIYNDLDANLTNFWMQMVDHAYTISERLQQLPYSRALYYEYYRSLFDGTELGKVERAVRWFYALRGTGTGWLRRSPVGWNNTEGNIIAYRNVIEDFSEIQGRFRTVAIDNRDAKDTFLRYDCQFAFTYVDTPYFGAELYYEASKDGFDHVGLAHALNNAQGMVAVSYYEHPLLDELYPPSKWRRVSWEQAKSSQVQHRNRVDYGSEVLLMNYPAAQHSLWETTA